MHPSPALSLSWLAALAFVPAVDTPQPAEGALEFAGRQLAPVQEACNQHTASTQELAALGRDALGRTVVAWQSKRQEPDGSYGIFARRFDASGRALGGEVHVNLRSEGAQHRPAVALEADGAAWFAWESYDQDGEAGGVVLRRLAADLRDGSNELLVDARRDGHQGEPALAVDAAGRVLVVWTGPAELGGNDGARGTPDVGQRSVRARLFDAQASPLSEPFVLAPAAGAVDRLPCVAGDPRGGFQVSFARADLDGTPAGVLHVRVGLGATEAGALVVELGPPCTVASGLAIEPSIDVASDGRALLAWMEGEGGAWRPAVRALSASGELGPVRRLDPGTPGYASGFGAAFAPDGSALAAWSRRGDERGAGLFVQRLAPDLEPVGEPGRVAGEAGGGEARLGVGGARRLALGSDASLALAWDGSGPGDGNGVFLTLFTDATRQAVAELTTDAAIPVEGAVPHDPPFFSGPVDPGAAQIKASLSGPDHGFPAITQTSLTPPDPHVSAGPDHVVVVVNGRLTFYDHFGNQTFTSTLDGPSGFWAALGASSGFIFDPETLYDPHTGRFMMMANERNGNAFFLLAVSDDSDPNGTWHKYRFDVTAAAGDTDIDSPNFAVDDQAVYLTADFFGPDKFLVYMVEKAPLLSGLPNPVTRSLLINGSQSYGVPVTYDAGAPAQYLIEAFESFSNTAVRFHAITDPLGTPQRVTFDLSVPTYTQPEDPPQQGTSVRPNTFESRFWSAMFRGGSLWATHHVNNTQVRQRWYEFAMNGWPASGQNPSLAQSGEVIPGEGVRSFFGSIWADEDGNAGLVYARSSPTEFISMERVYREVGDPPGQMTPGVQMQTSTEPDFSGRWGDYSGTVSDPEAKGAFWGCHEYRQAGLWRTWVGLMGPCETPASYCTAKLTSIGSTPAVGFVGEPSVGVDAFQVTMTGGLPGKAGLAFYGSSPAANPFFGGLKCVANPIVRTPLFVFDAAGSVALDVPVTVDLLGHTRYYQFWFRDPLHPDGTTVGLSDGLQLTFCP